MGTSRHCQECGLAFEETEAGARCPHCLLRLALAAGDEPSPSLNDLLATPSRPRFFAGYELLDEIACGGMGVVWKARQLGLNRLVALKTIPAANLVSPGARLRFRTEIEAVARLDHPNIVTLYETGDHDGQRYFSMKLVEGGDLARRLPEFQIQSIVNRPAARLLATVARAVHHAHQRGILHRDLKPSNILIDEHGEPHVADFGIAKVLGRETGLTHTESVLGSPNYMAPEQASGHSDQLTVAADVYSLGAILYEVLTGRPPFQAPTAVETMRRLVTEEVVPPHKVFSAVDADLETICLKCLQKEPAARYGSAEAFAEDLERWLSGRPIDARPIGMAGQLRRWCKREPRLALAVLVSLVLLLAAVAGTAFAAVRVSRAERRAVSRLRESLLDQARILRLGAETGMRNDGLRLIRQAVSLGGPAKFRQRARDELLATLALTDLELDTQPQLPAAPNVGLALLDPRMERFAHITDATNLVVTRVSDGHELRRFGVGNEPVIRVEQFSPDGRFLALRHADGVSIVDLEKGDCCFKTNGPQRVLCFAWDRPVLVLEEWRHQASFRELPTMREIRRVAGERNPADRRAWGWTALALSPDGGLLATARRYHNVLELIDVADGRTRWRATNSASVNAIGWCPLRERIVTAGADGLVTFWRLQDGQPTARLRHAAPVRSLAVNDNESLLAIACENQTVGLWSLSILRQILSIRSDCHRIAFHEDGVRLGTVVRDGEAGWLDISHSAEFREFMVANVSANVEVCRFSPDGRILGGGLAGGIDLRNVTDARPLARLPVERIPVFAFDPRGAAVLTSDSRGVSRWTTRETMKVTAREIILPGKGWRALAYSSGGDWFAAANIRSNAAFVFDRTLTNRVAQTDLHAGVDAVTISRSGRWLATGSERRQDVKVWNLFTHREVLDVEAGPLVEFSPNDRWLVAFGEKLRLFSVGSWREAAPLPLPDPRPLLGAAAFSPDGRLLAVIVDHYEVQLFDLDTWQALGVLQPPHKSAQMNALAFSPDGSRLAAACSAGRLRVWNLRLLRQTLAEFDLDWDLPPLPIQTGP